MKSGKQRRAEIHAKRKQKAAKRQTVNTETDRRLRPVFGPPVNAALLAPNNSYGAPDFVSRGYYADRPFRCVDCGKEEVWTGTQQKWWCEVAKGFVYTRRFAAGYAGVKSEHRVMSLGACIWKG